MESPKESKWAVGQCPFGPSTLIQIGFDRENYFSWNNLAIQLKWVASFRWSFGPYFVSGSIATHSTLIVQMLITFVIIICHSNSICDVIKHAACIEVLDC